MGVKIANALSCPHCGAKLARDADQCSYCGTWMTTSTKVQHPSSVDSPEPLKQANQAVDKPPDLAAGEFGLRSTGLAFVLLTVGVAISLGGWALERPGSWWSKDEAIAVWCGAAPVWSLLVATVWRPRRTKWVGVLWAFVIGFLPFVGMVMVRTSRFNDDALGLGAFVGACNAVGFLVGMLIHSLARRSRSTPDPAL